MIRQNDPGLGRRASLKSDVLSERIRRSLPVTCSRLLVNLVKTMHMKILLPSFYSIMYNGQG